MIAPTFTLRHLGDRCLSLDFGDTILAATGLICLAAAEKIREAPLPGVTDVVPSYTSVAVHYQAEPQTGLPNFRTLSEGLTALIQAGLSPAERAARTGIKDKSKVFNTARVEALELDNLIEVARSTMISADARKESRGAHDRADCHDTPENPNGRNDKEWLKHTMWYRDGDRLEYKAVNLQPMSTESIELKVRSY
jgi:succinate dehydrogenase/fumarate reductase flavoprotein subunit